MPNAGWGWASAVIVIALGIFCGLSFYRSCGHQAHAMPAAKAAAQCPHDSNRPAAACE